MAIDDLDGKLVTVVCNLKPAKLRGIVSEVTMSILCNWTLGGRGNREGERDFHFFKREILLLIVERQC